MRIVEVSKRLFFVTSLALACCVAIPCASATAAQPNIVLIVSDDQGYGDAACYGAVDVETPAIDAIAERGVRFTQFRVNPLCAPTRASILSGLYSLDTGMWRGPSKQSAGRGEAARVLERDIDLLPALMKQAGYATGMFGKWHLGYESPDVPNERGFDEFVGFLAGSTRYTRTPGLLRNDQPFDSDKHTTDLFTDEAVDFIRRHGQQPFFCYVAYNAVHGPLWSSDTERPSAKADWLAFYEERGLAFPRRDYAAVLSHMDHSVGRIVDVLAEIGAADNTLVVFVSDNGAIIDKYPGNNGPLRGAKGTTYEGGIRVPAAMQWPGVIPAGMVSDAPAAHFDLFATILDAATGAVPSTNGRHAVAGASLLPHLRSAGKEPLADRYLFWDLYGKLGAAHGDWKIVAEIANHHGKFDQAAKEAARTKFELYNLRDDIGETTDLADKRPEVAAELQSRYVQWLEEVARRRND